MTALIAYVAGIITLPLLLVLIGLAASLRNGTWTSPSGGCRHSVPIAELDWRLSWKCPKCGGRWVRRFVFRVVPNRFLVPPEVRA